MQGGASCTPVPSFVLNYSEIILRLDKTSNLKVSFWPLADGDDISHYFLTFYRQNNRKIKIIIRRLINNEKLVVSLYKIYSSTSTNCNSKMLHTQYKSHQINIHV